MSAQLGRNQPSGEFLNSSVSGESRKIRNRRKSTLGHDQEGHSRSLCDEFFGDRRHCRENCRDFVDVSRTTLHVRYHGKRRQSRHCGATITCDESANLVKDHETWDASNLAPRTQVVLALPVLERAFNMDLCIICLFPGLGTGGAHEHQNHGERHVTRVDRTVQRTQDYFLRLVTRRMRSGNL